MNLSPSNIFGKFHFLERNYQNSQAFLSAKGINGLKSENIILGFTRKFSYEGVGITEVIKYASSTV